MQNLDFVLDHNKKFEKGDETFDVAINSFADMVSLSLQLEVMFKSAAIKRECTSSNMATYTSLEPYIKWVSRIS